MPIRKHAAKRDSNEGEIILALKAAGCSVEQLNQKGVPDLLVYSPLTARHYLMEVKTAAGSLTPDQKHWFSEWGGEVHIVRSIDDALKVVGRAT